MNSGIHPSPILSRVPPRISAKKNLQGLLLGFLNRFRCESRLSVDALCNFPRDFFGNSSRLSFENVCRVSLGNSSGNSVESSSKIPSGILSRIPSIIPPGIISEFSSEFLRKFFRELFWDFFQDFLREPFHSRSIPLVIPPWIRKSGKSCIDSFGNSSTDSPFRSSSRDSFGTSSRYSSWN